MGHQINDIDRLFRGIQYDQKSTSEIRLALQKKISRINELIEDRNSRVAKICQEYTISEAQLTNLVLQYHDDSSKFRSFESQGNQSQMVPAGAIANIVQEKKMCESERSQLRKLELVLRNLQDTEKYLCPKTGEVKSRECFHELNDNELEYLGF